MVLSCLIFVTVSIIAWISGNQSMDNIILTLHLKFRRNWPKNCMLVVIVICIDIIKLLPAALREVSIVTRACVCVTVSIHSRSPARGVNIDLQHGGSEHGGEKVYNVYP